MRTPILNAASGSSWRNVVAKTWEFLHRFYEITDNTACSTHVHISLNTGYSLTDLKRIACSVIHFETAFEALVPDSRHGNGYCKSNWLDGPDLARKGLSRPQSIDAIDAADNTYLVENLIQKPGDKSFAWNFDSLHQLGTIEFRKPPASITVEQALGWAELAMNFIQVSIEHGTPDKLKAFPSTIKGLRAYLSQVDVPGVNERYRMDWIWRGKDENGFRYVTHQRPGPHEGGKVMDNRLLDLNKADARRIMEHARSNGVPKSLRSIF